ncbi:MAG: lipopolysaccharide heptosyltransferase II [Desulfobaccales bacterium]
MSEEHPRFLIIKLSSLGDVLHALPTLESLRAAHPLARITWLVEAAYAPLLDKHPALDQVWVAPRLRPGEILSGANPALLAGLLRRLRTSRFDVVIDLQGLLKSAVWVALARSPRKLGYDRTRELSYLALNERLAPFDPEAHAIYRYLHLARHLGAPADPPRLRLGLGAGTAVSHLLPEGFAEGRRPLVVLHPGARWPSKQWPAAAWARLGDRLGSDRGLGLRVAITGSAADGGLAAEILQRLEGPALNLAGRTSLAELAALLRQAALLVTPDTGAMHLAAALGTRVVALFGPTAPWRTGPYGDGHAVLRLGLDCSPCFKRRCPAPRCLTDLPPETVLAACEKILFTAKVNG